MTDDIRNRLAEVLKRSAHNWDTYDFDPNWDYSSESEAIVDAILEAFDVTEKGAALSQPEQAEEWEYGMQDDYGLSHVGTIAEAYDHANRQDPALHPFPVRRRKAGPWMPMEEGVSDE